MEFSTDELYAIVTALGTQRKTQEKRLRALEKNAGGRNYLSNEREQEATRKRITELERLRIRVQDEWRECGRQMANQILGRSSNGS